MDELTSTPLNDDTSTTASERKHRWRVTLNAPVTVTFVAACVLVTALGYATNGWSTTHIFSTWHSSSAHPLTYVRLFTHVLGHGDWGHLVGNMAYILLLGPLLEEKHGSSRLLGTILITALVTALANRWLFGHTLMYGASGVVFAFIVLASITDVREGEVPLTFILVVALFLGQQIWQGATDDGSVAYLAHFVGGAVGAVAGFVLALTTKK